MKKCEYCAEEVQNDAKKCKHCGEWLHVANLQNNTTESSLNVDVNKIEGFGGWLALFGFGVFVTPIYLFFSVLTETDSYDSLGIIYTISIIIAFVWLNHLMVKRKKVFKKWFLGVGIIQILFSVLAVIGVNSEEYLYTDSELSEINISALRTIFYVLIWSLYLWNSKRVKNTFRY